MSAFVAVCACGKKVGLPRPGSVTEVKDIKIKCPFCDRDVFAKDGFEVPEPVTQKEEFDLLKVD